MADEPDLVRDARANETDWVRYLQQSLDYWGYWSGDQDGAFSADLDAAVRSFQEVSGLVVDGWVGPKTWSVLNRDAVVTDFGRFPTLLELAEESGDPSVSEDTSCRAECVGYDTARARTGSAIEAAIVEAGSVAGSPSLVPTLAAVVSAGVAAVAAGTSFVACLEHCGKVDEAERQRRDVEQLRDEVEELRELAGVS